MKAIVWVFSALALLLINAAWIWRLDQLSTDHNQTMTENRNRYIQTNRELYLMNRAWELSLKSSGQPLPAKISASSDDGISGDLRDFIGSSKKLILVVSDHNCSTCVDQLLFMVKNEIPELNRERILILFSADGKTRSQWRQRQRILTGSKFLEIPDKCLGMPMDSLEIPYFFISGPDYLAGQTFTPYPTLDAQTREYLKEISNRYLKETYHAY